MDSSPSHFKSNTTIRWLPSIKRPERVLDATVEQLYSFLKMNTSREEQRALGASQMNKIDLRRHCIVIATRGGKELDDEFLQTARLCLSPFSLLTSKKLLTLAAANGLMEDPNEDKDEWFQEDTWDVPNRSVLIEMLAENCADHVIWSDDAEEIRRAQTKMCLVTLKHSLGHFRFLEEAKHFLWWAQADVCSLKTVQNAKSRLLWLSQLEKELNDVDLTQRVLKPIRAYMTRHILPFLEHFPYLIPFDLATFKNMEIDAPLKCLYVVAEEEDKSVEESFFMRDLLIEKSLSMLRAPQKEALDAIKSELAKQRAMHQQEVQPSVALFDQYRALSHLRLWFRQVLQCSYSGVPVPESVLRQGEKFRDQLSKLRISADIERPLMVVLPTGVGKTMVMCLAPFVYKARRVLVLSPNVQVRNQLTEAFRTCYTIAGMLDGGPVVAVEGDRATPANKMSDVFVCNNQRLQGESLVAAFSRSFFDLVIVDEAHHAEAYTYRLLREHFFLASFLYATATPFRGDKKEIDAVTVFSCTMADAIKSRYIKNICYLPVPVCFAVCWTRRDGVQKDLVLSSTDQLVSRSDELFNAVHHSEEAKELVMSLAIKKLRELRAVSGVNHQVIVQADSQDDALDLTRMWRKHPEIGTPPLAVDFVASFRTTEENADVLHRLRSGALDIIIHFGMLGEGFDHPQLSVCCIFRRFGSFPPFAQFVGRVLRRLPGQEDEKNNKAFVIAHPALGLAKLWELYTRDDVIAVDEILVPRCKSGPWEDMIEQELSPKANEYWFLH